jgi:hypothetical protein
MEVHAPSDFAQAARRRLTGAIVVDAPPEADRVRNSVRSWPAWVRLVVVLSAALALWAGIIASVWWLAAG